MAPTRTGKHGKMGRQFRVREMSGNFVKTRKASEFYSIEFNRLKIFIGYWVMNIFSLVMLGIPIFINPVLSSTNIQKRVLPQLIYMQRSTCKHSHVWMPHELKRKACSWKFTGKMKKGLEKSGKFDCQNHENCHGKLILFSSITPTF